MDAFSTRLRRVLVTGAGGFVGGHLIGALKDQGAAITAFMRTGRPLDDARIVEGDLLDADRLTSLLAAGNFDAIFHLAGLNAAAGSVALYQANVAGTAALLQAVRALGRPGMRVVLAGSSAEYGASPDDPITEESPTVPVGDYGVSKLAATRMGQLLHAATGQATLMVRPFNIIGPGACTNLLHAQVARKIVEMEAGIRPPLLELSDLGGYRDFVDVRDVAAGLIALAERGEPGEVYNLCSGQAVQARILVEHLTSQARIAVTVQTAGAPRKFSDVAYQRGSFEKAGKAAGWSPVTALEKSLTDTLNYWRKCGNKALSGASIPEVNPR